MSEINLISPLLDGMKALECFSEKNGCSCWYLEREDSDEQFVLKHISIPASDTKTEALILTGAVADEAEAQSYFEGLANDIRREVIKLQSLSGHSAVASWGGYQVEPKDGTGYDVYLLMPRRMSLNNFLKNNAMTQLQALNFGIDLCNALGTLRDAGYVYLNLKPENIFVDDFGRYMIGDLGLMPLENLNYCAVPEDYLSDFSAPELLRLFAEPTDTSDIYSLGLLLYYIFNGNHLPFDDGKTKPEKAKQQRLRGDILPSPIYADYELAEIISKACNVEAEERWQNPAELRQALTLYMQRNEVSDQLLVPPLPLEEESPIGSNQEPMQIPDDEKKNSTVTATEDDSESLETESENESQADRIVQPQVTVVQEVAENDGEELEPVVAETIKEETEYLETVDLPIAEEQTELEDSSDKEEVIEAEEAAIPEEATEVEAASKEKELPSAEKALNIEELDAGDIQEVEEEPFKEENDLENEMSIDELLASVNNVLAEDQSEKAEIPDFEANEAAQKELKPKKKRRKAWIPIVIVLAILVFLGGVLAYFYFNWYLVNMDQLEVIETTESSIEVGYKLSVPDPDLSWDCVDTYGNSFPGVTGEDSVIFNDLTPGTQYNITFYSGKLHKLQGTYTITTATAAETQIISLDAALNANNSCADISMVVSGPEPEEWTLTYSSTNSDSGTVVFSGHTVQVSGLQLHNRYTFELQGSDDIYLTGETSCELAVIGKVEVRDLQVVAATEDSLSVTWESVEDSPLTWSIHCAGDGYDEVVESSVCAATFHGTNLDTAYTFTVSAEGLDVPVSISLPANATVITSLDAEALDAGSIQVNWTCADPQPEGGWKLSYLIAGDTTMSGSVTVPDDTSVTLRGLPANSEIVVTLATVDGESLIGTQTLSTATVEAPYFDLNNLSTSNSDITTYLTPEDEDWVYSDLGDSSDIFNMDDSVTMVLESSEKIDTSNADETSVTVVLRAESGKVVKYSIATHPWNELLQNGRYIFSMPLPNITGKYQIELYFNNQFVNSKVITVNGSEEETSEQG